MMTIIHHLKKSLTILKFVLLLGNYIPNYAKDKKPKKNKVVNQDIIVKQFILQLCNVANGNIVYDYSYSILLYKD